MPDVIASDATIATVLSSLRNPERYVCGVLDQMFACRKAHGNAAVRIGVTGTGLMPYYRVIFDAEDGSADSNDRIFGAYFDNHTPLEWKSSEASNRLWSSRFMSFEEVQALLPQVRPSRVRNVR
ncbi:hypothetical protein FV222_09660 [Methylobacterium sp. WL103]|uniref:hypothetical protein n=1 Tax=Methylobacterium sp. WL103 TaxID=2603891 RepID=UPI0011CA7101|nr:hypothetical protein [Methylobacterium sp. WL103]TXN02310.1 hypothetical protein FV222_09660 [Methylobacterium sp. WL103]